MTTDERARASLCYLRAAEMVSRSRDNGDIAGLRLWEKLRDEWHAVLRREEMHPEAGPQGDAAL